MKPESFLTSHSIFTREEFTTALRDRGRAAATVHSHLARWIRQGRIARIKQGVFVRIEPTHPIGVLPDLIALASRMAPDAAVAYHTALEAHGVAQSIFERLTFVTWTKARSTSYQGRVFTPVRPRVPLFKANLGERWIERTERSGIEIRVTNLERTVADVLDRPELAGGVDEVWRSIASIPAIDPGLLEQYVNLLASRTLAAKVGFFLETRREELIIPTKMLERLRIQIPRAPVAMDRRRRGRLIPQWALIVPVELLRSEQRDQQ